MQLFNLDKCKSKCLHVKHISPEERVGGREGGMGRIHPLNTHSEPFTSIRMSQAHSQIG